MESMDSIPPKSRVGTRRTTVMQAFTEAQPLRVKARTPAQLCRPVFSRLRCLEEV